MKEDLVRNRSTARLVNAIMSALVLAFFVVHSLLGGLEGILSLQRPAAYIPWIGVGVVVIHVVMSIVTSYGQLTDAEFPPSSRKKRHLLLKWLSGICLAVVAAIHIVSIQAFGSEAIQVSITATATVLLLVVVLVIHVWIGAKSLITDLGLHKGLILPLRIVLCVVAVSVGCIVVAGLG